MQKSHFKPRNFLPETIDLTDTAQLAPVFDKLAAKLDAVASVGELEACCAIIAKSCAALAESSSVHYIEMTCQTDDEAKEKAYMHIVEVVDPWLKPRQFALMQKLSQSPFFTQLPAFYEVYRRSVEAQVKIYREENVARETQVAKLTQQYQKISGGMTVQFDGKEQTLARMGRIQEEPDRPRREAAWKTVAERRLLDADKLEELFDQLLVLRNEIAHAAGFSDFRAYTFANYERFDYTPEDCLRFHDAVEHHVVPLARELQEERRQKLGLEKLRPWDLAVDPDQNPPLHPFTESSELLEKCHQIFSKLDPRLGEYYHVLRAQELVDLDNRKGKAPGGYQSTLSEARVPFIFMNAVGVHRDVETMLHEAGHAFHALASREQPLHPYRSAPIEFCEVASMGMELLAHRTSARFIPMPMPNARNGITSRASSNSSPGWPRSTPSSTGSTRIPATPATSAPRPGSRSWTASAASRTGAASRNRAPTSGIDNSTSSRFRFIMWNTASRNSARFSSGRPRDAISPPRSIITSRASASAARVRFPSFSRPAASPSTSPTKPSRPSCAT